MAHGTASIHASEAGIRHVFSTLGKLDAAGSTNAQLIQKKTENTTCRDVSIVPQSVDATRA